MPQCSFLRPLCACLFLLVLSGCSLSSTGVPSADAGFALTGIVRGGQQAIVGAQVYLFAANTTGYGGLGMAASSSNASRSLLTNGAGRTLDSSGGATNGDYYVITGAGGAFSITGDYSCTPNTQVYVYALGGNPGSGTNAAAGLLAALGNCPSAGNFLASTPTILINEVSTIAAAYAFAGFATDATHVSSSGTVLAQVGIQNAFANAANLAGLSTGAALATTPAGNGTAPQSEIDTLANILAACVNTTGTISGPSTPTACYTLFNDAQSGGGSGTVPSDTATAAINMAHNPGANIAALYALSIPTPPFGPALSAQPNDFTVGIQFSGGGMSAPDGIAIDGLGNAWVSNYGSYATEVAVNSGAATQYTGGGLAGPQGIAVDPTGNIWITNFGNASVTKLNGISGAAISGANGYTGGGLQFPLNLAIDGTGNVWVGDYAYGQAQTNGVAKINGSTGAPVSGSLGYKGGGVNTPFSIAVDGSGNVWDSNYNHTISKLNGTTGAGISTSPGYTGLNGPLAIDGSGNVWQAGGKVLELSGTGSVLSLAGGYSGGGISSGAISIAIDGAGNAWVGNYNYSSATFTYSSSLSELKSGTGAAISPSTGYTGGGIANPYQLAVDGSGNVWSANFDGNNVGQGTSVTQFVGLAAPVVTPLAVGVKNNTLGTRP